MKPNRIIIHHSLTKDSETVSWGAIRRYHTSAPPDGPADGPYSDIGYHAGVELVYGEYEALFGRPWHIPGAHTKNENHDSLGFCFIGNYDEIPPPDDILKAGAKILYQWMGIFGIKLDDIYCHRDFNPGKTCPGLQFDILRLENFISRLIW